LSELVASTATPPATRPRFGPSELTLPSPPLGLALVLEAAENEDTSLQRLGWLINREPSLTTHVLKLSNSAAYSVGRQVSSVSQATVYLGARTIRNMTLSHIVRTVSLSVDVGTFDTTLFWEHSLRRAGAAHVLATRLAFDDPGEAFTAGLIQDLGLLVMAVQWPDLAPEIEAAMALPIDERRAREVALTGTTHDAIFALIADSWGVPQEITRAIAEHHAEVIKLPNRRGQVLAEILRLSDAVADLTQVSPTPDALTRARGCLDNLRGGKRISLETVIDETVRAMSEMSSALEIRVRPQPSYEELIRVAHRVVAKVSARYEDETRRLEAMLAQQVALRRDLESKNEQLARLATTDPLTGVANRRALCDHLDVALQRARDHGEPVTLLMIDLDRFKLVNDTHGHDAGDAVLKETATRLSGALRGGDVLGRLGGEEFAVVLVGCLPEHGPYVAERLRIMLGLRPFRLPSGDLVKVTTSIGGTSVAPGQALTLEETLKRSDLALYACKHSGRNRVSWYTPELEAP
jgi:diguanylate cyclase (GGDEF)-like protein